MVPSDRMNDEPAPNHWRHQLEVMANALGIRLTEEVIEDSC